METTRMRNFRWVNWGPVETVELTQCFELDLFRVQNALYIYRFLMPGYVG
jgi:hypothetical protein